MTWIMMLCMFSALIIRSDIVQRLIKNHDVILLFSVGLLINLLGYSRVSEELFFFFGAGCVAFLSFLPFYIKGWMGAGDVKLAGALGIWLGFDLLFPVWVLSVLMALLYVKLASLPVLMRWLLTIDLGERSPLEQRKFVPYGAMLCMSAILVGVHRII